MSCLLFLFSLIASAPQSKLLPEVEAQEADESSTCQICGKVLKSRTNLEKHMTKVHAQVKWLSNRGILKILFSGYPKPIPQYFFRG